MLQLVEAQINTNTGDRNGFLFGKPFKAQLGLTSHKIFRHLLCPLDSEN